jgi:aminoglycoside phosphotransferase (APT) family kinase protein
MHESVERLAKARGISSLRVCRFNQSRSDRVVYRLGDEFVIKMYTAAARDRYERERTFLELDIGPARRPDLVEATFDAESGGYLLMTALPGRLLVDIHQELTANDYTDLAGDLGACIAAIHAVPLTTVLHLPPNTLEAERRRHFDSFPEVLDRLKREQIVPEDAAPVLIEAVEKGKTRAFASPRRFIHGDVHSWNVFLSGREGRWSCALIDFEESAPGHVEMEFVYPFVGILGEAFPGRRLAASWDRIWQSFVGGYASIAKAEPDPELIVAHVLAWYLWVSADSLERRHPKCREFASYALDALACAQSSGFQRSGVRSQRTAVK